MGGGRVASRILPRTAALVALVVYAALFVRWSVNAWIDPVVCCHAGETVVRGKYQALVWARTGAPRGPLALAYFDATDSPLTELLQGAYYRYWSHDPAIPLLPCFLFFLLGLVAIYLLGERLGGPPAALLLLALSLGSSLFAFYPLNSGQPAAAGLALSLVTFVLLGGGGFRGTLRPLLAGSVMALAILTRWTLGVFLLPALALLFAHIRQDRRRGRYDRLMGLALLGAFTLPVAGALLGSRYLDPSTLLSLARRDEFASAIEQAGAWSKLLAGVRGSVGWLGIRAVGAEDGGPALQTALLLAFALALLGSTVVLLKRGRRSGRREPLLLTWMLLVPLAPLSLLYSSGESAQMVVIWLVAGSTPALGKLLASVPSAPIRSAICAGALALALTAIAAVWVQSPGSPVLRHIATRTGVGFSSISHRRESWSALARGLRSIQGTVLASPTAPNHRVCFTGGDSSFPWRLLFRDEGYRRPAEMWRRLWESSLFTLAATDNPSWWRRHEAAFGWARGAEPWSLKETLSQDRTSPVCRWLFALQLRSGSHTSGWTLPDGLNIAIREWARLVPRHEARIVLRKPLDRRWTLLGVGLVGPGFAPPNRPEPGGNPRLPPGSPPERP